MSTQLVELRRVLESRFPDAVPVTYRTAGAVATGVSALDRTLPGGGLPRGRLTAWAPGGGATAVLVAACGSAVERGERAVWVDGGRVAVGDLWRAGPVLVRPEGGRQALGCAEELLRSGGFALVVLAAVEAVGADVVRLSRAAREGGGAFVVLSTGISVAALRLASRIRPDGYRWREGAFGEPAAVDSVLLRVEARAMGWSGRVEFSLPVVDWGHRLALDPELVDRRGVAVRAGVLP